MASRCYTPTPEQLAIAAERKVKKQKPSTSGDSSRPESPRPFRSRPWVQLQRPRDEVFRVKVMTWNLLAQCLVRRSLFPTSTCLKASQRDKLLHGEILSHHSDIICLQESFEVDRTEKLLPVLENAGFSHLYASAPNKRHGCLIAWTNDKYSRLRTSLIDYDEQEVRVEGGDVARRGSTCRTTNIASLVALERRGDTNRGFIVATTHLFWHSRYTYERTRQAGILVREVIKFRDSIGRSDWPCIIAGDFNFPPDDPAYSLLVGDPLTPEQESQLAQSRVVNRSIDPTVPRTSTKPDAEDGEDGDADDENAIANTRPARPTDGLLSNQELSHLFSRGATLRSAYDEGQRENKSSVADLTTFGDRAGLPPSRRGFHEPEYTAYAHYWKTVLDYIFLVDPPRESAVVHGFARPHRTEDLQPALPKTDVCGSDHISLCAELGWETIPVIERGE